MGSSKQTELEQTGVEPTEPDTSADGLEDGESVSTLDDRREVAARSADTLEPGDEYRKVFVLGPGSYTKADGFDHEPNLAATRQYALAAGLWPTGDARFVSSAKHDDGVSRVLTYAVPVKPAHEVEPESPHPEVLDETGSVDDAQNADASKA